MKAGPIASVAVVGGGQVALLAATALARAMPNCVVTVVSAPVDPAALADTAHTTLPTLARMHQRIGLTERTLLDRVGASHRLATRYEGWRDDDSAFLVGYGAAADPALFCAVPRPVDLGVAAALARTGHFALPADDPASPLSDLDYALRFDRAAHLAALTALAQHLRIATTGGTVAEIVRREDGTVASIGTTAGEAVAADFFVDCSGPSSSLRSPDQAWIDWSAHLPIDRIAYRAHAAPGGIAPLDTATAFDGGYVLESPGRDAMHRLIGWSSSAIGDDVAAARMGDAIGPVVTLHPGRLAEPWSGNVVAIGDAAAAVDPIGWTNLHLAIVQIETLLEVLPRHAHAPHERREFNRRTALAAERVADFVAAHSVLRPWAARFAPSVTLARTDAGFLRRGRLPVFEEDSIARELWGQLLFGVTAAPGPSAYVAGLSPAELATRIADVQRRIGAAHSLGEPYATALTRLLRERE